MDMNMIKYTERGGHSDTGKIYDTLHFWEIYSVIVQDNLVSQKLALF